MLELPKLMTMVQQLGREFRRRGMQAHLPGLRLYWLALQHGLTQSSRRTLEVSYSEALIVEWFKLLRMGEFKTAYPIQLGGASCPNCPPQEGHAVEVITEKTFPDGRKVVCLRCKAAWLELDTPGWVVRAKRAKDARSV